MINNNRQQQNGRRRGRGGQRQGGGGGQGGRDNGSRIDNRSRGNAVQLLEKYKSLAADAQRQGDRVNTEYYLQFADHYFRVVSEQRGRFEEQNPGQSRNAPQNGFDEDDDFDGDDNDGRVDPQPQQQQPQREYNRDGGRDNGRDRDDNRGNRDTGRDTQREAAPRRYEQADRDNRGGQDQPRRERFQREREDAPVELPAGAAYASEGEPVSEAPRPRRARAPRRDEAPTASADTFDIDRLPPSFAPANDGDDAAAGAEEKPRRRRLRPAGDTSQAG